MNDSQNIREGGSQVLRSLPGGVQVLIDWIILLIATLASFVSKKRTGDPDAD